MTILDIILAPLRLAVSIIEFPFDTFRWCRTNTPGFYAVYVRVMISTLSVFFLFVLGKFLFIKDSDDQVVYKHMVIHIDSANEVHESVYTMCDLGKEKSNCKKITADQFYKLTRCIEKEEK